MATAKRSRRDLQTTTPSGTGASSAVPRTPQHPPIPTPRLPTPSTSPPVGVKHQDGEKLSSMEKRKFRSVKWAKAPDSKRFKSPMAPISVKSLAIRLMVLPKLTSPSTAPTWSPSPILMSPSQDPEATRIPSAMGARKKRKRSSWTYKVTLSTAISTVLDNDDLLGEVLLRLTLPTSHVRAALVCRQWLCVASTPSFLDRFYDLVPSHVLGFYVHSSLLRLPKFAPMPGLPSELAASVRHASSALDAYVPATSKASILCCRHSYLLVRLDGPYGRRYAVLSPLRPARGMTILPPPPSAFFDDNVTWLENSENPNGGVTVCAAWKLAGEQHQWTIYELRDSAWHNLASVPGTKLPQMPVPCFLLPIDDNKIWMSSARDNAKGRWASSETSLVSFVVLPDGVECTRQLRPNFASWADDSFVYLIHVDIKALQLRVWLYRKDSENWSLDETLCLRTAFADSGVTTLVSHDGMKSGIHSLVPRRNAPCLLLQVGTDVVYIDIKSRTAKKVYTITPEDGDLITMVTFTMIFPPVFPVIKVDND